jgi:hypothetical protein
MLRVLSYSLYLFITKVNKNFTISIALFKFRALNYLKVQWCDHVINCWYSYKTILK